MRKVSFLITTETHKASDTREKNTQRAAAALANSFYTAHKFWFWGLLSSLMTLFFSSMHCTDGSGMWLIGSCDSIRDLCPNLCGTIVSQMVVSGSLDYIHQLCLAWEGWAKGRQQMQCCRKNTEQKLLAEGTTRWELIAWVLPMMSKTF